MNKHIAFVVAVGALLGLPAAPSFALAAPAPPDTAPAPPPKALPPKTLLDTDKRLDRLVSVSGVGLSLSEVAAQLSDKTLTLRADDSCADQKVQLRVRNQPLRAVLAGLAQLLPGEWVSSDVPGRGYDLSMSRDAQADRARWWDTFLAERDRELAFQRGQVLKSMQDPAAGTPPDPAEGNGGALMQYHQQRFFNSLPASVQNQVAGEMDDTYFYTSCLMICSNDMELATVVPYASLPAEAQRMVDQELDSRQVRIHTAKWPDLNNTLVVLANDGYGVFVNLVAQSLGAQNCLFSSDAMNGAELPGLSLNQSGLPAFVDQSGPNVPYDWQVLADYQRKRFWKNDPPKPTPKPAMSVFEIPPTRTVDWLARVGDKADIDYIADYYSLAQRPMTPAEMAAPLAGPLKQELDAQAVARDLSWKKTDGGLYLFRDNRWYRDDELEVSNTVLTQIKAGLPQTDSAPAAPRVKRVWPDGPEGLRRQLDVESAVASQLTPWQIANGLAWYVAEPTDGATADRGSVPRKDRPRPDETNPFAEMGHRILKERNTLKFYAGLSDEERSALIFHALPVSALDPDQRAFAIALAPQLAALLMAPADRSPSGTDPASALLGLRPISVGEKPGVFIAGQSEALRLFVSPPPTDGAAPAAP